jgi:hypothetical protein
MTRTCIPISVHAVNAYAYCNRRDILPSCMRRLNPHRPFFLGFFAVLARTMRVQGWDPVL